MSWYETKHWVYESYTKYDVSFILKTNQHIKLICPTQWCLVDSNSLRFAIYCNGVYFENSEYHKTVDEDMLELINAVSYMVKKNQF